MPNEQRSRPRRSIASVLLGFAGSSGSPGHMGITGSSVRLARRSEYVYGSGDAAPPSARSERRVDGAAAPSDRRVA